jgi:hypothetical protein
MRRCVDAPMLRTYDLPRNTSLTSWIELSSCSSCDRMLFDIASSIWDMAASVPRFSAWSVFVGLLPRIVLGLERECTSSYP